MNAKTFFVALVALFVSIATPVAAQEVQYSDEVVPTAITRDIAEPLVTTDTEAEALNADLKVAVVQAATDLLGLSWSPAMPVVDEPFDISDLLSIDDLMAYAEQEKTTPAIESMSPLSSRMGPPLLPPVSPETDGSFVAANLKIDAPKPLKSAGPNEYRFGLTDKQVDDKVKQEFDELARLQREAAKREQDDYVLKNQQSADEAIRNAQPISLTELNENESLHTASLAQAIDLGMVPVRLSWLQRPAFNGYTNEAIIWMGASVLVLAFGVWFTIREQAKTRPQAVKERTPRKRVEIDLNPGKWILASVAFVCSLPGKLENLDQTANAGLFETAAAASSAETNKSAPPG